jgi:hypothetical protein
MDLRSLALAVCAAGLIVLALLLGTRTLAPAIHAARQSDAAAGVFAPRQSGAPADRLCAA